VLQLATPLHCWITQELVITAAMTDVSQDATCCCSTVPVDDEIEKHDWDSDA